MNGTPRYIVGINAWIKWIHLLLYLVVWQNALGSSIKSNDKIVSQQAGSMLEGDGRSSRYLSQKRADDIDLTSHTHQYDNVHDKLREISDVDEGNKGTSRSRWKRQVATPTLLRIEPTSGPQVKEIIYIYGENFGQLKLNVSITIGSTPCHCTDDVLNEMYGDNCRNDTIIACAYENASDSVGQAVPVVVTTEDLVSSPGGTLLYTFKENVKIYTIEPLKTIISGGTRLTITGDHFTNVPFMRPILTTVFNKQYLGSEKADNCVIVNDTCTYCIMPEPRMPQYIKQSSTGSRGKRGITFCLTYDETLVDISIEIGRVIYQPRGEEKMICVTKDPKFYQFKNGRYDFKRYEGRTDIQLSGQAIDYGIAMDDYKVFVGLTPCNITRLAANVLYCNPPLTVPEELGEHHINGMPEVRVLAGQNGLVSTPGVINYQFTMPVNSNSTSIIGGVVGGLACLLIIVVVIVYVRRRDSMRYGRRIKDDPDYQRIIPGEGSVLDLLDEDLRVRVQGCRLSPDCLERDEQIGSGFYGRVFVGRYTMMRGETMTVKKVAIKTIKDGGVSLNQLREFLKEATLMKDLEHENVVKLIGVVIEGNKPFVVLPFMENRDLKSYVSNQRNRITVVGHIGLCIQVADGMTFISEQNIIHRDLRAVNCLVDHNITVKVADFGLSRDLYQGDYYMMKDKQRPLPVKWMSIEALEGDKYSTKSDVWSYGVLMWEVFTHGLKPYADIDNRDMKNYIGNGRRLEQPKDCTNDVYAVMMSCWETNRHKRRSFRELSQVLNGLIEQQPEITPTQSTTGTEQVLGEMDELADEKDIAYYPRASTNEYIKRPGSVNYYLTLLSEEAALKANAGATNISQNKVSETRQTDTIPHQYENDGANKDGYLVPTSSRFENDLYIPMSGSHKHNVQKDVKYIKNDLGDPELYVIMSEEDAHNNSIEMPLDNQKIAEVANPVGCDISEKHAEENVILDAKSLVRKLGSKEKTEDYVNQPAHYKRKQNT